MDIKKADSKGRVSGFTPDTHYFITGPLEGAYRVREVPVVSGISEGYEPAEVSEAKDAVMETLYDLGVDEFEDDLIGMSDRIVDDLLKKGAKFSV